MLKWKIRHSNRFKEKKTAHKKKTLAFSSHKVRCQCLSSYIMWCLYTKWGRTCDRCCNKINPEHAKTKQNPGIQEVILAVRCCRMSLLTWQRKCQWHSGKKHEACVNYTQLLVLYVLTPRANTKNRGIDYLSTPSKFTFETLVWCKKKKRVFF